MKKLGILGMTLDIFRDLKVVIAAGGTGGHVFPAAEIARVLLTHGAKVFWVGSADHLEEKVASGMQIPFEIISYQASKIKKRSSWHGMMKGYCVGTDVLEALSILRRVKPHVVIGFGSYFSFPTCVGARLMNIPFWIHEQNATLGRANQWLLKFARGAYSGFAHDRCVHIGNPLRLSEIKRPIRTRPSLRVLITGGSLGAQFFSEHVPPALFEAQSCIEHIRHQTGPYYEQAADLYRAYDLLSKVTFDHFIQNMQEAYEWADVVITRGGALSLSEIACASLPSVIIPYARSADQHQFHNAKSVLDHHGGLMLEEASYHPKILAAVLVQMASQPLWCHEMGQCAKQYLDRPQASYDLLTHMAQSLSLSRLSL